jgi:manganese transport protein
VIANDPDYMGEQTNGRVLNAVGTVYLGILLVISVATIPLMIITKGGA